MARPTVFEDRVDAARRLAESLRAYRGREPLVLAVPRGGVPVAAEIAKLLGGQLDVVLVRKLLAPGGEDCACGAVDERGQVHVSALAAQSGASCAWIEQEARRQVALLEELRARYTPGRDPIDIANRVVIVVDDGMATGQTMLAALRWVQARGPARLVCAVPVGSPAALRASDGEADVVVCLTSPEDFVTVSRHYRGFPAIGDEQVLALLGRAPARRTAPFASPSVAEHQRSRSAAANVAS